MRGDGVHDGGTHAQGDGVHNGKCMRVVMLMEIRISKKDKVDEVDKKGRVEKGHHPERDGTGETLFVCVNEV